METAPKFSDRFKSLPKSLVSLSILYILLISLGSGETSAQRVPNISSNLKLYPSPSISLEGYSSNFALSMTLASAMRYVTGSLDQETFEENMNRAMSYTSADEAINDSFALNLATMSAFNNLLYSEEFEEFRNKNDITSVDKLVDAVLHLTISLDFDRSINDAILEVNPETGLYEVVGTTIGGAQQAYINELQIKLVAGRWVYHRNKILEEYANDINIVKDGKLTDTGKMMALIEFANWSNIFRVISDVGVFTDPDITYQVTSLINTDIQDNPNLTLMIYQQSSDPESFVLWDYNVFYPGSELYNYLLQILNGQIKPHRGVKALKYHDSGAIEVYYDMNYKEEIRATSTSNQAQDYLTQDSYAARLSPFQRERILQQESSEDTELHPNLATES
jgi:hypothetical protein